MFYDHQDIFYCISNIKNYNLNFVKNNLSILFMSNHCLIIIFFNENRLLIKIMHWFFYLVNLNFWGFSEFVVISENVVYFQTISIYKYIYTYWDHNIIMIILMCCLHLHTFISFLYEQVIYNNNMRVVHSSSTLCIILYALVFYHKLLLNKKKLPVDFSMLVSW